MDFASKDPEKFKKPGVCGLFNLEAVQVGVPLPPGPLVGVDPGVVAPITTGTVQLKQHWFHRPHPRRTYDPTVHLERTLTPPGKKRKRVRRSRCVCV